MSTSLANSAAPVPDDTGLIRKKQVAPLPIGPGGSNPTKRQLNDTNVQLAMLKAQTTANTKYDPPVPIPITKQVTIQGFTGGNVDPLKTMMVIGGIFIVYGLIAK